MHSSKPSSMNATHMVKLLTLILVGFAGGLLYHLGHTTHTATSHEQMLQANDQIVQNLATENQQHTLELERLRNEIEQHKETAQRLRSRNQLIDSIEQHEANPQEDPHAVLWTNELHDARLEDAHRQAQALLGLRGKISKD